MAFGYIHCAHIGIPIEEADLLCFLNIFFAGGEAVLAADLITACGRTAAAAAPAADLITAFRAGRTASHCSQI